MEDALTIRARMNGRLYAHTGRGYDLIRPACGGPPSPEPLPLVAGEGFWMPCGSGCLPLWGRWISAKTLAFLAKDG